MESKPREYRNNNASETIDTSKVSEPTRGFYARVEDRVVFVDTTDATDYGIKLQLVDVPEKPNRLRHTLINLIMSDGSVSPQGYLLNIEGRNAQRYENHRWLWADDISLKPGLSRKHYAPTLEAMMKFMRSKLYFTSCVVP